MSGVVGKKNSTLQKESVKENKLAAVGSKDIKFWHEASEGETTIPFGSLNMPASILANGLDNPTSTSILSANLGQFHSSVQVYSSKNQKLLEGLSYKVQNAQIKFVNGYTAEEGEIFEVSLRNNLITGTSIVDARPLTATGVLLAGNTTFIVGEAFKVGANPDEQIGDILVFVDGILQFRNVGNETANPSADGNYQEVYTANSGGYGISIEFNEAYGANVNVQVISRNLIAERPDSSMMQLIETLGGQIDNLVAYVAADAGIDPILLQSSANQIDLKAFGNLVIANREVIKTKQNTLKTVFIKDIKPSGVAGGDFVSGSYFERDLNTVSGDSDMVSLASNKFTILEIGKFKIKAFVPAYRTEQTKAILVKDPLGSAEVLASGQRYNEVTGNNSGDCFVQHIITITEPTTFNIQNRCGNTVNTSGRGVACTFGDEEVYTQVEIIKLS